MKRTLALLAPLLAFGSALAACSTDQSAGEYRSTYVSYPTTYTPPPPPAGYAYTHSQQPTNQSVPPTNGPQPAPTNPGNYAPNTADAQGAYAPQYAPDNVAPQYPQDAYAQPYPQPAYPA